MEQNLFSLVLQSVIGLAAVLGLFAFMVWGMRRFQDRSMHSGRDFRLLQKIHIDNRSSIVEVRHQGRHYLLALSANGICQLSPDQALPDDAHAGTDSPPATDKGEA